MKLGDVTWGIIHRARAAKAIALLAAFILPMFAVAATPPGTVVYNQASVIYTPSLASVVLNSNVDAFTVAGLERLNRASISVSSTPPNVYSGDSVTLNIGLANTGDNILAGGALVMTLPAGISATVANGMPYSANGNILTITLPDIAIAGTLNLQAAITLPADWPQGKMKIDFEYQANGVTAATATYTLNVKSRTRSLVEIRRLDDSNGKSTVISLTGYDNGTGVFADITPPAVSKNKTQRVTDAPLRLSANRTFHKEGTMFIWINDGDRNTDPSVVNTVVTEVEVKDEKGVVNDKERLQLKETGPDTGIFTGYVVSKGRKAVANDGWLGVEDNEQASFRYADQSDGKDVIVSILIDPYGKVFNSLTGQPLDGVTVKLVDADTGLAATVYGDDGVSAYPATVTTGGSVTDGSGMVYNFGPGAFRFPFAPPGNYRLQVVLPTASGFTWPSIVSTETLSALAGGPYAIDVGSRGEIFALNPGPPLHLDIPVDPIKSALFIRKNANKDQAAIGDFLQYQLDVRNTLTLNPVTSVVLTDVLPHGFKYQKGSLRINNRVSADPVIAQDGRTLTINIGSIAADASATLSYVTQIAAARPGEAVNAATATAAGGLISNRAQAKVQVREDLMRSKTVLMGRVGIAGPDNKPTPEGLPGVRVYLEDGTYSVTDEHGLYHFEGIAPGSHVVQLDLDTLPEKYEAVPTRNTRFAGRAWSQFVDVQGGGMWRVDFNVAAKPKDAGQVHLQLDSRVQADHQTQEYTLAIGVQKVPVRNMRLTLMLPGGVQYIPGGSKLDNQSHPDPVIDGNVVTYHLGDAEAGWTAKLQLSSRMDLPLPEGDMISKAMLVFDTPEQQDLRTPVAENVLATEIVEAGRETLEFTVRPMFEAMNYALREDDKAALDELIAKLSGLQNIRLQVNGYTDNKWIHARSRFVFKDNTELSLARAHAVAQYLREALELMPSAITVIGKGAADPVADNVTEAGRALNRRVEVHVIADKVLHKTQLKSGQDYSDARQADTLGLRPGESWAREDSAPYIPPAVPVYDDAWLEGVSPGTEWLLPAEGYLPAAPAVNAVIKHAPRQKVVLLLNGREVDKVKFEYTHTNATGTVSYSVWRGIDLAEGDNRLEMMIVDEQGKALVHQTRSIHYSGAPVQAEWIKSRSVLTADGITRPVIALRFTDKDGYPARRDNTGEFHVAPPYAVDGMPASNYSVMPGSPADRPSYTIGEDGIALITLQPTTEAGEVKITLPLKNGEHTVTAGLTPILRDWILVGFAEGTVGYNTLSGNVEPLQGNAAEEHLYQDGRLALYAKGRVKGEWLMTLAYDSARKKDNKQLYGTIDPGTYYTLYGDNSSQRYEAASAERLYLKMERNDFYALFGDYSTDLNAVELARYNRNLTGLKSRYRDDKYEAVLFASESNQAFIKDEIRGAGIVGPYYLSRKNVVMNSETVKVQVRDRFRSEVIISENILSRHTDYDIDYVSGSLSFREPVFSADRTLNPEFIVVDYESYDSRDFSVTYGGRAGMQANDKMRVGLTHVNEGRAGGEAQLIGADATYQVSPQTQARVEVAHSKTADNANDLSGNAYLAEIAHRAAQLDAKAYVREQGEGYGLGQNNGSEYATRKIGAEGVYHANEALDVQGQAFRQSDLATGAERDMLEIGGHHRLSHATEVRAGIRTARDTLGDGTTQSSRLLTAGASQSLYDGKLILRADREQALGAADSVDFPSRTRLGADYRIAGKTSLYAEQEWADGAARDTENTLVGLKTSPWDGSEAFSSVSHKRGPESDQSVANMGLRQRWSVNSLWSLDAGLERSKTLSGRAVAPFNANVPFAGGADNDFTATSLGVAYNPGAWLWTARAEYRDARLEHKRGLFSSVQGRPHRDLDMLLSAQLWDSSASSGTDTCNSDVRLGLAYRPLDSRWIILDKLDWIRDRKEDQGGAYDNRRIVNNLNANYQADEDWQVSLQYGAKLAMTTIDGAAYSGYVDLIGLETRYDLSEHWDIGVHGDVLHAWEAHQYDYSYGLSSGYTPVTNMWISAGYNFTGFKDLDFAQYRTSSKGPYVQVRMKFDQRSMKDVLDREFK